MADIQSDVEPTSILEELKADVERNPTDLKKHLRLGWVYYGEDKLDEAIDTFRNAKKRFPEDIEVLYALALAYKKVGKGDEALEIFRNVIKSAPNLQDQTRGAMLRRLAIGHANVLERGDWNLKNETWERK
jgi:cytochrome c-type biogenesis protein CcmH/NrfG